jgi:hypothetical protein
MSLVQKDLRGNVLRGAAYGVCSLPHHLSKAEINEFQEAVVPNHDVFRLEVPVTDIFVVQILEDRNNLGSIKPE